MFYGNSYTFKIDIEHLVEVLRHLRENNFSDDKWNELGLELGIIYTELKKIKANNPQDVSGCVQDCLALWLQCNYNTSKHGKPTMESLAAALRRMGLSDVASGIMRET